MSLIRIGMAVFRRMALNCCRWVCRFYHHLIQLPCHVIRGLVRHLVAAMAIPISETQNKPKQLNISLKNVSSIEFLVEIFMLDRAET